MLWHFYIAYMLYVDSSQADFVTNVIVGHLNMIEFSIKSLQRLTIIISWFFIKPGICQLLSHDPEFYLSDNLNSLWALSSQTYSFEFRQVEIVTVFLRLVYLCLQSTQSQVSKTDFRLHIWWDEFKIRIIVFRSTGVIPTGRVVHY